MGQDWQQHGQPHQRSEQPLERVERTERNPFAAPGPIWANPGVAAKTPKRSAGSLRFPDLIAQRGSPLAPGENPLVVQRQRHGERVGFPRRAKDRAVVVARYSGKSFGSAPSRCRFDE